MLKKRMKKKWLVLGLTLLLGLFFVGASTAIAVEPKAGDVIDSSNIDQYKDYFPDFMQRFIKDGWGWEKPVVIKVKAPEPQPWTKAYEEATKKSTAKLTAEGLLEGYSGVGAPFYEPKEPDLALKIMWNQFYKNYPDSWLIPKSYLSNSKRKGGSISITDNTYEQLMYSNRTMVDPMPELDNPKQLLYASKFNSQTPPNKDMATLTWRYKDALKYDDMWTYVPTLRRTLRLVSSERANPIRGSPYTWDDIFGFDGKIPLFTYKMLGEATVLGLQNMKLTAEKMDRKNYPHHPIIHYNEEYETIPCYLVEIRPKDPRYPSARKMTWVQKSKFGVWYAEIYDKSDQFWKGFYNCASMQPLKTTYGDEKYQIQQGSGITDFKTQYYVYTVTGGLIMNGPPRPDLFDPGSLGTF